MADISTETTKIKTAIYGEEVRDSIVSALEKMNDISEVAEEWATGGSGGEPSETNNAKHYAEQAADIAASFEIDQTLSVSGASAEAYVTGKTFEYFLKDVNSDNIVVNGGIRVADGVAISGTTRLSTVTKFSQTEYETIYAEDGYEFFLYAWDGSEYLGSYKTDGTFSNASTGTKLLTSINFARFPVTYNFKIVARRVDQQGNITLEEAVNILYRRNRLGPDKTLSVEGEAADAAETGKKVLKYYTPTSTLHIDDMPRNSYTFVTPANFDECPEELLDARGSLYVERRNMSESGDVSLVTVIDENNLQSEYTTRFTEPNALRSWVKKDIGTDLTEGYRSVTLSSTSGGITYEWDESASAYHITGTKNGTSFYNITRMIPTSAGKKYYVYFAGNIDNVSVEFYGHNTSDNIVKVAESPTRKLSTITIPNNIKDFYYRFIPKVTTDIDEYVNVYVTEEIDITILKELSLTANIGALPDCDLDDLLTESNMWLLSDSRTYDHTPSGSKAGYLFVFRFASWTLQVFVNLSASTLWLRRGNSSGAWTEWAQLSGGGGEGTKITNEFYLNHYTENFNATVSPTITTDRNQYLAATGDETDVKASIETLLNETGVCRLGPGDFYVSGVFMPENSMLIGSGRNTRLILLGTDSDEGYAVKLNNSCTVRDMSILSYGKTKTGYVQEYNYVNRHGILFDGNFHNESSAGTIMRSIVDGCEIWGFSGGGITCYDTGTPVESSLAVSNTFVICCTIGINVYYSSEFNHFTACKASRCHYGSLNNGGNNLFIGCNFSGNVVGMYMDNSSSQSTNNSHGSVVGCIFDHSNHNVGLGIKIDGMRNGEVFSDCQLFYSDIEVNNSRGILFNNFITAGNHNTRITITDGTTDPNNPAGTIMFTNWMFKHGSYTIDIEDGYESKVHFVNCYEREGDAVIV